MTHPKSLARIALTVILFTAAASTARCEPWDPFGIQNHHEYMPFGKYGPKLTVSTPSPTKIRNGGKYGKKNYRVAQRTTPSRTTRFDDLNLSVTMPTGPWKKLDPKQTGSRACFLASRTDPTIMISLAGVPAGVETREQGDFEATDTNSSLLDESQAKMLSLPGGRIEPGEREQSAGSIPGIAYEATVPSGESTTYYALWVAAHHGYQYKLAVYGDYEHKPMIDEAMQNFLRGIKPIQPNRVARSTTANRR